MFKTDKVLQGDRISGSPIGSVNGTLAHSLVPPCCHIIRAVAQAVKIYLLPGMLYVHAVRVA
jgi:hypothetical protein